MEWWPDWNAATWAQVIATCVAAIAAVFSARSARASAMAGERMILAAERQRLDAIRRDLVVFRQAGMVALPDYRLSIERALRNDDDLPITKHAVEQNDQSAADDAIAEVDREMRRIESELRGGRGRSIKGKRHRG